MKVEYYKEYSHELGRDMEFKVYGHAGKPCLVFPAQDGRFFDFEGFGMIDVCRDYIEAGRIQFFTCDSMDIESWSKKDGNPRTRIETHERWYNYIVNELCPRIKQINAYGNGGFSHHRILTTGCSLGAFHALNFALRRPDVFGGTIAMSGIYEAGFFFEGYGDELTYANSPIDYLRNMPADHPYVEAYANSDLIVSVGQGRWENECLDSIHKLAAIVNEKNLAIWIDFWGYDVDHDWQWWKKQIVYFLQFVC